MKRGLSGLEPTAPGEGNYSPQLYKRENDPDELTNVAEKYPRVVAGLNKKPDDYMAAGEGLTRGSFHGRPT